MFKRSFCIIAAALVVLVACVSTRAQEEPTNGIINGRVVNDRGEAMPGATVMARAVGTSTPGRMTTSDAEGNFRFTALEPALYTITTFSPAYVLLPPDPDNTTPPYYRVGDSVRLELIRGGVITGTVTNAAGEPITGVRVRAFRVRDAKGKAPGVQYGLAERTTDDRGIYRLYGLGPGTYIVNAGGAANQSFQFNPFETDAPTYSPSATRDNAAELTVRGGEEVVADIRYRSETGHVISGTVKGTPGSGAALILVSSDGHIMPLANGTQPPGARGFALNGIADGEYTIFAQEVVQGTAAGSTSPSFSLSDGKRVSVRGADVGGIELITKPVSALNGVVLLEPSKAPECQGKRKPLFSETLIELQRNERDTEAIAPFMRGLPTTALPDQKGAFNLRNLMPARYRFHPRFYARYWYLQSISIGAPVAATPAAKTAAVPRNDVAATWTVIKSGENLSNVTIKLAEGAASIRGKIGVAEGAAIPSGMAIYLLPAEREKVDDVLRYFVAQVAADGAFALNNLPPGRYLLAAQNPALSETATLEKLRLPESAEARIKLRRTAETQKADLELKPCQNLTDYRLLLK